MKWKSLSSVQLLPTPRPIVHEILQARVLQNSPEALQNKAKGKFSLSLLQGIFPTRDWTQVSHIAGGFFTSWATRKPKDTGVGSLSLLQWIFPTQESNQDLLHYRGILYQPSYQGRKGR